MFSLKSTAALLAVALALAAPAAAHGETDGKYRGSGFIGIGITMYSPACASACGNTIPKHMMCPPDQVMHHEGMHMRRQMDMDMGHHDHGAHGNDNATLVATKMPMAGCVAHNMPYLQSVAYCISTHCGEDVTDEDREKWWAAYLLGRVVGQPSPALSYAAALPHAAPTEAANSSRPLTAPVLVDEKKYLSQVNALSQFQTVEKRHAAYGLIIMVTSVFIPVFLSLLRFVPFPTPLITRFRGLFIDPPLIASEVTLPLFGRLNMPTRGQSLFVFYLVVINFVLSFAGNQPLQPNAWFNSAKREATTYIANRTGVLSFANLPVLIVFSGRNSILLWMTNWSHATLIVLHRAVAIIATLQACLHSAMYLQIYLAKATFAEETKLPYWVWGIVATLTMSLMLPLSVRALRVAAYEIFLIGHVLLAVFTIVGCWYHIVFRYGNQWGYETWLYITMAVWGFDRLMRFVRLGWNGLRTAYVYRIDDDYLRVDIPGVRPPPTGDLGGHIYTYFPLLGWKKTKPWESHPFSVALRGCALPSENGRPMLSEKRADSDSSIEGEASSGNSSDGKEASTAMSSALISAPHGNKGITLFVRIHAGVTSALADAAVPLLASGESPVRPVRVLLESYASAIPPLPPYSVTSSRFRNTVFIAGGVGISGVLPQLIETVHVFPNSRAGGPAENDGRVKLFWGVRTQPLVLAVESAVAQHTSGAGAWGPIEAHVSVGARIFLPEVVETHAAREGGTEFVVCGPRSMVEETRALVAQAAGKGAPVRFVEELFEW